MPTTTATRVQYGSSPPIIVLGEGVTALGALRCLGRAGHAPYVVSHNPGMLRHSRWFRPLPWGDAGAPTPETLEEHLREAAPVDRAVLLPGSDDWARSAAALPPSLKERFPASVADRGTLERLLDKGRFARVLEETGTPHPRTMDVSEAHELGHWEWMASEGGFLKPRNSAAFFRRFGVKAFAVSTARELRGRFEQARDAGLEVMLQEYVPGPAHAHVFLDGFVDSEGTMTGLLVRRRLRMYPEDFGNSTLTVTIPPDEASTAVDTLRRLLDALGYRGIFSAEFKQDPRDGVFKLLEVNPRAWWYVDFTARCGVDVCSMAYRDALGLPVPRVAGYRTGARCLHVDHDLAAFRQARRDEGVHRWRWFRPWVGAHQTVLALEDPGPALHALSGTLRRRLRALRRPVAAPRVNEKTP